MNSRIRGERPWRRAARRAGRALALAGAGLALLLAGVVLVTWVWWLPDPPEAVRSRGFNAAWLRHQWVEEPRSQQQYAELAAILRQGEISDPLFHVGPLEGDGTIPAHLYPQAETLLAALDEELPGARVQAYIGQVERRGGGPLDLADPAVRAAVVATAERFLDLGFDGIHYDIEPIHPGDPHFLDLLERTGQLTRARGAVLSVALEELEVAGVQQQLATGLNGNLSVVEHAPRMTRGYLRAVAERVDQVAIMTYGFVLPADWLFGRYVAWQTEQVTTVVGGRAAVLMGVPTEDVLWSEHVRSGIRGVRKGLAGVDPALRGRVGVAVFAGWTTTPGEWAAYREDWVGSAAG